MSFEISVDFNHAEIFSTSCVTTIPGRSISRSVPLVPLSLINKRAGSCPKLTFNSLDNFLINPPAGAFIIEIVVPANYLG